jgi:hypothetical protein
VADRIAATYAGFNACGAAVEAICTTCGDYAMANAPANVEMLDVNQIPFHPPCFL